MAPQTYKQMRCSHGYAGQCKRAGGYHFLVIDWLPWTLIGMCRPCAEEVRKDLIYHAERAPFKRADIQLEVMALGDSVVSQVRGADPAGVDASKFGHISMLVPGNEQVTPAPLLLC
jgi:hypothetical protein